MLSKNKIKFITSLSRKRERDKTGLFIAEGEKLIFELMKADFRFNLLVTLDEKLNAFSAIQCEKQIATDEELKKISLLSSPPTVIAVCYQRINKLIKESIKNDLTIVLEGIQDPGNLGTIIRLASWFGISQIICSENTVDCYNPKVIQSTMGSIAHVEVYYTNLLIFLKNALEEGRIIYGTFMDGDNIYLTPLEKNGIIVFGNEGNGISHEIIDNISRRISIPSFSNNTHTVESLNVSIATSIVCSEFKRRSLPSN